MRFYIFVIVLLSFIAMWVAWVLPANSSSLTRQDELQNLYQQVDRLDQTCDRLYQWAQVCEKRIIKSEKREEQLDWRVRKLEGRLYEK